MAHSIKDSPKLASWVFRIASKPFFCILPMILDGNTYFSKFFLMFLPFLCHIKIFRVFACFYKLVFRAANSYLDKFYCLKIHFRCKRVRPDLADFWPNLFFGRKNMCFEVLSGILQFLRLLNPNLIFVDLYYVRIRIISSSCEG